MMNSYTILDYLYYLPMEAQKSQKSLYRSQNCLSVPSEKQVILHTISEIKYATCIEIYGDTLYLGSHNSKVYCYELQSRNSENPPLILKEQKSFYPHCNNVNLICASQQFLIIIPLLEQQLIRIWNRQTLQILYGYQGHEKQITKVKFLRDKQHIASISYDGTARIWKISQNFECDTSKLTYTGKYPLLTLQEIDNETIGFGGDDCTIILWNWKKQVRRCRVFAHAGSILLLSYYYPFLISAGGDSKIKIWIIQNFIDQVLKQNNHPLKHRQIDTQSLLNVRCVNQIKVSFNNHLFYYNLSDKQFLILDSQGKLFTLMDQLTISTNTIALNYTQRIKSMKIWQNMILFVSSKNPQKGEFKIATFKIDSDKHQVQRRFQAEQKSKNNRIPLKLLQNQQTEAQQHLTK